MLIVFKQIPQNDTVFVSHKAYRAILHESTKWGCGDHIRIGAITQGKWASRTDIGWHLRKVVVYKLTKKCLWVCAKKCSCICTRKYPWIAQKSARGFIQKSACVLVKRFVGKWLLGFRYISDI